MVARKNGLELREAAHITRLHRHAITQRAELLRRANERRDAVAAFGGLAHQLAASSPGRAEDQEAHGTLLCSGSCRRILLKETYDTISAPRNNSGSMTKSHGSPTEKCAMLADIKVMAKPAYANSL